MTLPYWLLVPRGGETDGNTCAVRSACGITLMGRRSNFKTDSDTRTSVESVRHPPVQTAWISTHIEHS